MKALKIIGIILGVIAMIIVGIILTLKGEGHLERSITINAPVEKVFKVVNSFSHNKDWSPWFQIDPDMTTVYSGPEKGVGAKYAWESEHQDVGTGEQEIIEVKENELVNTTMAFGGMTGTYYASFILKKIDENRTEVTWTYDGTAEATMEKFFIDYLVEPMLGPMYEQGMTDLKSFIEGLPDYPISIEEDEAEAISYIGIRVPMPTNTAEIGPKMGQLYGQLGAYMGQNSIAQAGMPMTVYYMNDDGSMDMEVAMPTAELIEVAVGNIITKSTPTGMVLKGIHLGDYNNLHSSYEVLLKYAEDHNYEQSAAMYEIYVTDPGEVADTTKWQTDIYIPVRKKQ